MCAFERRNCTAAATEAFAARVPTLETRRALVTGKICAGTRAENAAEPVFPAQVLSEPRVARREIGHRPCRFSRHAARQAAGCLQNVQNAACSCDKSPACTACRTLSRHAEIELISQPARELSPTGPSRATGRWLSDRGRPVDPRHRIDKRTLSSRRHFPSEGPPLKVLIVYYSTYGNVYKMARTASGRSTPKRRPSAERWDAG